MEGEARGGQLWVVWEVRGVREERDLRKGLEGLELSVVWGRGDYLDADAIFFLLLLLLLRRRAFVDGGGDYGDVALAG